MFRNSLFLVLGLMVTFALGCEKKEEAPAAAAATQAKDAAGDMKDAAKDAAGDLKDAADDAADKAGDAADDAADAIKKAAE